MATGLPAHVASGELITSPWGNAVVDELTRQRTVLWNMFGHPGGTATSYGAYDIGTTGLGPYTFPVRVTVLSNVSAGYGGSGTMWHSDVVALADAGAKGGTNSTYTHAALYQNVVVPAVWDVPAGQNAGFKTRMMFDASDATPITLYFSAGGIYIVQRTDIS